MKKLPWIVWLLLVPPWAVFFLVCYWLFLDNGPPVRLDYQSPHFVSHPVSNRAEAEAAKVERVPGGSEVWTYSEFCVLRQINGVYKAKWQAGAFMWPVDEREFSASPVGCYAMSFVVPVPTSNPTRTVQYISSREYRINPLHTWELKREPIPLTILANQ
jgi:hypothetical protein